MKRVEQPSLSFESIKVGDIIYNKRQGLQGKVIGRKNCLRELPKSCHHCRLNGKFFQVERLDGGGQGSWCYGLWEEI